MILFGRTLASVDQCRKTRDGELTGPAMVASVRERFSGRSMPDLTNTQAQQIIDAIVTTFCH